MRKMLTRTLAWVSFCLLVVLTFSRVSLAVTLDTIKDDKVLISLDGSSVKAGDTFLVSDSFGKKRAFIKVTQVKGNKAVAGILKGKLTKAPRSYVVQPQELGSSASGGGGGGGTSGKEASLKNKPPSAWGVLFGYAQNSMKVTSPSVDMTGNGFNIEGLYERQIDGAVQMLARYGYQTFKATGTATTPACVNSVNCSIEINYLALDGLVKYSFFTPKITYWVGGGLGFSYAINKSSNVIDVSKISINQKILVDLGMNWYLNRKTFIPVQFEYGMFPNNSIVTSSQLSLRVGYGKTF